MARILIVDDEKNILELVKKYASYEGIEADEASNGKEALALFKAKDYDVVILDVMMPNVSGFDVLKKMRQIKEDVHCIFLTALDEEYNRVYGFDIGAEDYVTKPFSPKELMMRVKVILKRDKKDIKKLVFGKLEIDEKGHRVKIDGHYINLPNKEFELLLLLAKNAGQVLTRETIISRIWGFYYESDERTLDTHMKLLRKDLGAYAKHITTIRGVGYRFEKEI